MITLLYGVLARAHVAHIIKYLLEVLNNNTN